VDSRWPVLLCCALACATVRAADRIPVANEGGIRDRWMLADGVTLAAPNYPQEFIRRGDEVCVAVGYLLKADGTTSDYTLVKAWSSAGATSEPAPGYWSAFAEAAADALKQWRFKPRPEITTATPVYTVGTFVFGMRGAKNELRQHCTVPNLAARLRELKSGARRNMLLESLDLGPTSDYQRDTGMQR
jgi:hypothetical protein